MFVIRIERDGCSVEISKQIPKNEPVYLIEKNNGELELFEPTGRNIEIKTSDKLVLFCPGRRNSLTRTKVNSNELTCASNFRSKLHQSNCTKQVTGDLQTTTKTCQLNNQHGLIYRSGFMVQQKFIKLFEICYDSQSASPLYTHHQINGKAINCKIILFTFSELIFLF